jgi:hypothetical protein
MTKFDRIISAGFGLTALAALGLNTIPPFSSSGRVVTGRDIALAASLGNLSDVPATPSPSDATFVTATVDDQIVMLSPGCDKDEGVTIQQWEVDPKVTWGTARRRVCSLSDNYWSPIIDSDQDPKKCRLNNTPPASKIREQSCRPDGTLNREAASEIAAKIATSIARGPGQ